MVSELRRRQLKKEEEKRRGIRRRRHSVCVLSLPVVAVGSLALVVVEGERDVAAV